MHVRYQRSQEPMITSSERMIHTPSQFAKEYFFYAQEMGRLKSLKKHCCKRGNLDSFLFLVVLSGVGTLTYRETEYQLHPGDIAFIDCNNSYSHESSEEDGWELQWIHFNGNSCKGYYDYYLKSNCDIIFHPTQLNEFSHLIDNIIDNHSENELSSELITSQLITDLLTLSILYTQSENKNRPKIRDIMENIRQYINTHFNEHLTTTYLADIAKLGDVDVLETEFSRLFGITISKYIILRQVTYAKELLRFSMLSLQEIAIKCGFLDERELNEVFLEHENISPIQYKMHW